MLEPKGNSTKEGVLGLTPQGEGRGLLREPGGQRGRGEGFLGTGVLRARAFPYVACVTSGLDLHSWV